MLPRGSGRGSGSGEGARAGPGFPTLARPREPPTAAPPPPASRAGAARGPGGALLWPRAALRPGGACENEAGARGPGGAGPGCASCRAGPPHTPPRAAARSSALHRPSPQPPRRPWGSPAAAAPARPGRACPCPCRCPRCCCRRCCCCCSRSPCRPCGAQPRGRPRVSLSPPGTHLARAGLRGGCGTDAAGIYSPGARPLAGPRRPERLD